MDDFSSDPTADFLARERAILGTEADIFGQPSDSSTPGFPAADFVDSSVLVASNDVSLSNNDIFSANAPHPWAGASSITTAAVDLPLPMSPGLMGVPTTGTPSPSLRYQPPAVPDHETESIIKWRESFAQTLAERDAAEERLKQEAIRKAKENIDKFYEDYNAKRDRALLDSKSSQESRLVELNNPQKGSFWEQVSTYIELVGSADAQESDSKSTKDKSAAAKRVQSASITNPAKSGKDITRFKQVLSTLRSVKA